MQSESTAEEDVNLSYTHGLSLKCQLNTDFLCFSLMISKSSGTLSHIFLYLYSDKRSCSFLHNANTNRDMEIDNNNNMSKCMH